jgi:hypothetical protein
MLSHPRPVSSSTATSILMEERLQFAIPSLQEVEKDINQSTTSCCLHDRTYYPSRIAGLMKSILFLDMLQFSKKKFLKEFFIFVKENETYLRIFYLSTLKFQIKLFIIQKSPTNKTRIVWLVLLTQRA